MRKKIISGFLAFAMVFTSVQADVTALSTWGNSVERQNINSSAFGSTNTGAFGGTTSSTNAFGGSTGDGASNNNFPTSSDAFSSGAFADTNNSSAFDVYDSYNGSTDGSTSLGGSFGNSLTNGGVFEYLADSNVNTPSNDVFGESSVPSNSTTETNGTTASNSSNTTDVPTAIPEPITGGYTVSGEITVPSERDTSKLIVQLVDNDGMAVAVSPTLDQGNGNLSVPVVPNTDTEEEQDDKVTITSVTIDNTNLGDIKVGGQSITFTATVVASSNEAEDKKVTWSIVGKNRSQTISDAGVLTPEVAGEYTITATSTIDTSKTGTKDITISVADDNSQDDQFVAITNIEITGGTTVEEGSTLSLSTSITPTYATDDNPTIVWSLGEDDAAYATIDDGTLTPKEDITWDDEGTPKTVTVTAKISANTETGQKEVVSDSYEIEITKSEADENLEDVQAGEPVEPSQIDDLQSFFSQMTNSNSAFGVAPMAISTPNITIEDNTDSPVATINETIDYEFTNVETGKYTVEVIDTTTGKSVVSSNSLTVSASDISVNLTVPIDTTTDPAPTGSASISGVIRKSSDNVLMTGLKAVIIGQNGTDEEVSITADSEGVYNFSFTGLADGLYYILITGDAIENYKTENITLNDGDVVEGYSITVSPKKYEMKYRNNYTGLDADDFYVSSLVSNTRVKVFLSDNASKYLNNNGKAFTSWQLYKVDGTKETLMTTDDLQWLNLNVEVTSNGVESSSFEFSMPNHDLKIEIKTTELDLDTHTVEFSAVDANLAPSNQYVKHDRLATEPTQPTKDGYIFQGWYTTATGTTKWNFDTNTVTSDMTLYARWVGNTVKVKMNIQSGDSIVYKTEVSANVGEQLTINGSAIKPDGYYFSYWYWGYDYSDAYSKTYSMEDSEWCASHIAMNTSILIPPMVNGAELNLYSVWVPLTSLIYIDGIASPDSSGDSCVVTITNADYGTQEGIYYPSSSHYGGEAYAFDLSNFGTGMYTIDVVSSSGQEMTDVIYVKEDSLNYHTIKLLPAGKIPSVSNTSGVPNVGSNNLSEMFSSSELSSDNEVTIELQVSNVASSANEIEFIKENLSATQTVGLYVDITLFKNDGGTKYTMSELPGSKGLNVVFELPDSFKDQKSYFVSTVHDGKYSTINSANVSYDAASNSISFYTKELSVFAIGYKGSSSTGSGSTGSGSTGSGSTGGVGNGVDIPTADGYSVPLFQNVMVGQWIEGLGKYQLVHPEPTLWKFAGWYYGETGVPLTQKELDTYFVVTQAIMDHGIFPRFVAVDEDGNPLTSPVPSTGTPVQENSEFALLSLI